MVGSGLKLSLAVFTAIFCGWASAQTVSTSIAKLPEIESSFKRRFQGDWKFGIGSSSWDEGDDEGLAAEFKFKARLNWRFNSWLKARVTPRVELYSSRLQERDDADDGGPSRIGLYDAYLNLNPVEFAELHAGAIGQEELDSPLLISRRRAFPGFREILRVKIGSEVEVKAVAQQLVPTSLSFNSDRQEKEKLPSFQTQALYVSGTQKWTKWTGFGGHYQWDTLPSKVAFESGNIGNMVEGELANGSRFVHGFNGYFWGASVEGANMDYPRPFAHYRAQSNSEAPSSARNAELWEAGAAWQYKDVEYKASYVRWYTEPDSTVSAYAQARLGQTNRIGDGIELKVDFKEQGFSVNAEWYNSRTINDNLAQDTLNAYSLSVETNYAPF